MYCSVLVLEVGDSEVFYIDESKFNGSSQLYEIHRSKWIGKEFTCTNLAQQCKNT